VRAERQRALADAVGKAARAELAQSKKAQKPGQSERQSQNLGGVRRRSGRRLFHLTTGGLHCSRYAQVLQFCAASSPQQKQAFRPGVVLHKYGLGHRTGPQPGDLRASAAGEDSDGSICPL
jgi:hypothetical protein